MAVTPGPGLGAEPEPDNFLANLGRAGHVLPSQLGGDLVADGVVLIGGTRDGVGPATVDGGGEVAARAGDDEGKDRRRELGPGD